MRGKMAVNDNAYRDDEMNFRRPGTLPKWTPSSVRRVHAWVTKLSEGGSPFLTVAAPSQLRTQTYELCYTVPGLEVLGSPDSGQDWLTKGVVNDLTQEVRGLTGRPWGLVWDLLAVNDFLVEEPLRSLIDQGFGFTSLFKALWEARFLLKEARKPEALSLLGAVLRWICALDLTPQQQTELEKVHVERELESVQERMDMLLFLLALGYQNGLNDRTVLVLDGLEQLVRVGSERRKERFRELGEITMAFERWSKLGSATGILLGVDSVESVTTLAPYNDRFGDKLASSLV